jgi:HEAT repeat protein
MWKASLLLVLLQADPDPRLQAIQSLRPPDEPRKVQALLPYLVDPHPRVRSRARAALRHTGEGALETLIRLGLRHPLPPVRQAACEALGELKASSALPALLDRLADPDPSVRGEAARALGRLGDPAAADRLVQAWRRDSDWPLRAFALESLARLGRAQELLEEAARDPHYQVRLVAAEIRPAQPLVADRDWRVRAAAIEACSRLRDPASVGWLLDQLGREPGRLRWDVVSVLHDLTGNDLGLEADPWKAWWEAARETFAVRPAGGKGGPDPGATQASFFKVPILSTRVLFLLDLSGSMRESSPEGGTKLDAAKKGMLETIRSLPPGTRFGIAGLGSDEDGNYTLRERKTWRGRPCLLPATPEARADAERFVRGLEARGWTNLYDGIEYAFSDPELDTIFLYSDGGASKGTYVAAAEILSALAGLNRFRRIVIHAVEVPGEKNPPDNKRLLEAIASQTKGLFKSSERKEIR